MESDGHAKTPLRPARIIEFRWAWQKSPLPAFLLILFSRTPHVYYLRVHIPFLIISFDRFVSNLLSHNIRSLYRARRVIVF